jgi:hypothetical protein
MLRVLGLGGVKRPKRHIIRPGLTGLHRQVATVMAGHADLGVWSKQGTRGRHIAILLAKMDAISAAGVGEIGTVIDQERDIMVRQKRLEGGGDSQDVRIGHAFQSQLKRRNRPTRQRLRQLHDEKGQVRDQRRGNEVKLAAGL